MKYRLGFVWRLFEHSLILSVFWSVLWCALWSACSFLLLSSVEETSVVFAEEPVTTESAAAEEPKETAAEPSWMAQWREPSNEMRPLQMAHGKPLSEELLKLYHDDCGLGGLVVCVNSGSGYIRNFHHWQAFVENVKKLRQANMRVWIYDELFWPSLCAGGVVLEQDPTLESLELVYDKDAPEPFYVRPSYEYTFASMDLLRPARRHPNPLDPKATAKFLEVTHERYRRELGPDLYHQVEAFFTDEPTLLGCSVLAILTPEERKKGEVDPLDWNKKMLPAVPWYEPFESMYQARYGEALRPNFHSLFEGDTDKDRQVRRNFWEMVTAQHQSSYFGGLRRFCESDPQGPVTSGHTLLEEEPWISVATDGNKLEMLKEFQLPGQDLLNSNPEEQLGHHSLTNAYPCSAAWLTGGRRVMTEVSDFFNRPFATVEWMKTTAGCMAAWGVTEFMLYYEINGGSAAPYRNGASHKAYCDFVGHLNAVLREAQPIRTVALYLPMEILQEEYKPMAGQIDWNRVSKRAQECNVSFKCVCSMLTQAQIPFVLVDDQTLNEMIANGAGKENTSRTKRSDFDITAVIYPRYVERKNYAWNNKNVKEIYLDQTLNWHLPETWLELLKDAAGPRLELPPSSRDFVAGTFERDGKLIFCLVNARKVNYEGTARVVSAVEKYSMKEGTWQVLDPETGKITPVETRDGALPLRVEAGKTVILVSP